MGKGHKTRNNTIIKPTSTSLSVCTRTAKNQSSPLALPVVFSARLPPAAPRSTSANPLFFVGLVLLSKSLTADDDVADDDDDGVFYVSHHSRRRRRMSVTRAKETLRQLPSRVLYFTRCVCVYLSAFGKKTQQQENDVICLIVLEAKKMCAKQENECFERRAEGKVFFCFTSFQI